MGYLGDLIGRKKAMVATNTLVFAGALGSAILPWGSPNSVYMTLVACRFVLGVGVGGKYPLSATMKSEDTKGGQHMSTEVAKGFFWQTPGTMAPYIIAMVIFLAFGRVHGADHAADVQLMWRLLVGFGALPAAFVVFATLRQPESDGFKKAQTASPLRTIMRHPEFRRKLIGTGMCWFLYDFTYYGTAFYQPQIVDMVVPADDLFQTCWQNTLLNAVGLPAVVMAIKNLKQLGTKQLQNWGFVAITCGSLLLALMGWAVEFGTENYGEHAATAAARPPPSAPPHRRRGTRWRCAAPGLSRARSRNDALAALPSQTATPRRAPNPDPGPRRQQHVGALRDVHPAAAAHLHAQLGRQRKRGVWRERGGRAHAAWGALRRRVPNNSTC
jgi:MFS family permease